MVSKKAISKEGLKWRCRKHRSFPADIICLDGDVKDSIKCIMCLKNNSISVSNTITMNSILEANEHDILETYPPLKDQELQDKLRYFSQQQSVEEIDLYFKKLREDFEKEVTAAQQRAKKILRKQEQARQQVLEGYKRIAEIEKLKGLILSDKKGAEKDLDEFIKDKWNKAEENKRILLDIMSQYETGQHISSDEPNRIAQKMIDSLKTINFLDQSIQQQQEINLIKSTIGTSQQMEITRIDNQIYQIRSGSSDDWGQVYLDPILNPSKKYILQIELELKPEHSFNYFLAGIVKDEGRDNGYAYNQNMCYNDYSNCRGITRYIKGKPMQSGTKAIGKHSFEFRIHLDKKLLRVASLPKYSSIAELDDPNKINPKVNYRFFLAILSQGDMIRITKVSVVDKFDGKM